MFRRPIRPLRRAAIRAAMHQNPAVLQAIARANNLLAQGKPNDAAQIFERLAQEAQKRGHPKFVANAQAQIALAYAEAKNETAALTHARAALDQFIQLNMTQRAPTFFGSILQKLRANGMTSAADTLQREFGYEVDPFPAPGAPRRRLPSKCPHCAGPARSDEVEWIDAQSAECVYCGGVIQTEE